MHFKWIYDAPTPEEKETAIELGKKLNMQPALTQLLVKEASPLSLPPNASLGHNCQNLSIRS